MIKHFFQELFKYLKLNKLETFLGPQVLEDVSSSQPKMMEFVLAGQGTVLIKAEGISHADIYRVTGWSFTQNRDGTVSIKGNETDASTPKGEHQVFTDGKPLRNIEAMMNLLLWNGFIKIPQHPIG